MPRGSCLCGVVRFELKGPPDFMNLCHCSICRKVSGSSYGVFAHAGTERVEWLAGADEVRSFASSEHGRRSFCPHCGSNLPAIFEANTRVVIPAGTFDDDPGVVPVAQIFVASKAPWHEIAPEPAPFDAFPPPEATA